MTPSPTVPVTKAYGLIEPSCVRVAEDGTFRIGIAGLRKTTALQGAFESSKSIPSDARMLATHSTT